MAKLSALRSVVAAVSLLAFWGCGADPAAGPSGIAEVGSMPAPSPGVPPVSLAENEGGTEPGTTPLPSQSEAPTSPNAGLGDGMMPVNPLPVAESPSTPPADADAMDPEPVGTDVGPEDAPIEFDDCGADAPAFNSDLLADCTGTASVSCVFGGAPGQYDVTMLLGGDSAGATVVTAESRRFMLGEVLTGPAQTRCVSFSVNVREREGQPLQDVSPGTPGLNFLINGSSPMLQAVGVAPAQDPVVIYLAGDSTVCDQDPQLEVPAEERFTGWGQMLPQFFKRGVSVTNYADSGESTAAFRPDGGSLWGPIASSIKAGDFLLIQLGHNDKTTPAATYASRIAAMVQFAKQAGATPVLFSPIMRNTGDPLEAQHIYGDLVVRTELARIASAEQVAYIDLTQKTHAWGTALGQAVAQTYYVLSDRTHTNELGAQVFAQFVIEGLREQQVGLVDYLR